MDGLRGGDQARPADAHWAEEEEEEEAAAEEGEAAPMSLLSSSSGLQPARKYQSSVGPYSAFSLSRSRMTTPHWPLLRRRARPSPWAVTWR